MYDYAIYIGRQQPFHDGHRQVLQVASKLARKTINLVGSSNIHISPKNPWTYQQRKVFIETALRDGPISMPIIAPINDIPYNDTAWATQVREVVGVLTGHNKDAKIVLVGCKKDDTSFYLDMFPEWDFHAIPAYKNINATDIRNAFFQDVPQLSGWVAPEVQRSLKAFSNTDPFNWLLNEQKFLIDYRKKWGPGPFFTADAVVVQSGRILLVTRKEPPYKGALALPGGFVNPGERVLHASLRELNEETKISDDRGEIPRGILKTYIKDPRGVLFDDPDRSARGRIITNAYLYQLPDKKKFYVTGSDDAEKAQWYSLADLDPRQFMEDHWFIIQEMIGMNWK